MNTSTIRQFLKSPLGEAILSDAAIMGSIEGLRVLLRANRTAAPLQAQLANTPPVAPPPPPKDLPKALLKLTANEIKDVTEWMSTLHLTHKVELSKWALDDLETLFKLPADTRTQLISSVTGPTPADEVKKIKHWIKDNFPNLLNDESRAIIKEWEDWANQVHEKHKRKRP